MCLPLTKSSVTLCSMTLNPTITSCTVGPLQFRSLKCCVLWTIASILFMYSLWFWIWYFLLEKHYLTYFSLSHSPYLSSSWCSVKLGWCRPRGSVSTSSLREGTWCSRVEGRWPGASSWTWTTAPWWLWTQTTDGSVFRSHRLMERSEEAHNWLSYV